MERICLPPGVSRFGLGASDCLALTCDAVMSAAECRALRDKGVGAGLQYVTQAKNDEGFLVDLQKPQNHQTSVFVDKATADCLWQRLWSVARGEVEQFRRRMGCGAPLCLNRRLRVLRYDAADDFEGHYDQAVRHAGQRSLITVLLYLNDGDGAGAGFSGGETRFFRAGQATGAHASVVPMTGRVALFEHDLFHAGMPVRDGVKFILRTDVMFDEAGIAPLGPPPPQPAGAADGAGADGGRAAPPSTVRELLEATGRAGLASAFDAFGLSGSIEAFCVVGPTALRVLVREAGTLTDEAAGAFVSEAFAARDLARRSA